MKKTLRITLNTTIKTISDEEIGLKSNNIANKLKKNSHFIHAQKIGVFVSMENEVQTNEIVKEIFKKGSNCCLKY